MMITRRSIATLLALLLLVGTAPGAWAQSTPAAPPPPPGAPPAPPADAEKTAPFAAPAPTADADDDQVAPDQPPGAPPTPARLSYVAGEVSFWRPGGEDWAPAQVNTPLAPGDQLYTGNRGNLEIQIESRGFVRGWGDSQLGIENHEPDFLQLKVSAGHVSVDLRSLEPGRTVEIDTPAAAFTVTHIGYYRVDVTPDRTTFITRRGGVATMIPAGGEAVAVATSEQAVVTGSGPTQVQTFVAPELDVWDRWNYARTDALVDTVSARYVPADISGVDDLDQHGTWRVVPEYGSVWVPDGVAADWAPYTTGRWIWDPRFGWTWVDTAAWGWAPYHYGRWVHIDRVWAWAPGPVVVRPVYAPALVAFFGAPGVRVSIGAPFVSWVALGWGEPCLPWWGGRGFVGGPWWGGWGGPRVVNNVVIARTTTVVNVKHITVYRNVSVQNAVVAVRTDRFGRGGVADARIRQVDTRRLEPVRGRLDLGPDRASFAAASGRALRPPESVLARPVVATRAPVTRALPHEPQGRGPAPHIVNAPRAGAPGGSLARPPFGDSRLERARPPRAPRFDTDRRPDGTPPADRGAERRPESPRLRGGDPRPEAPRPQAGRAPEPGTPRSLPSGCSRPPSRRFSRRRVRRPGPRRRSSRVRPSRSRRRSPASSRRRARRRRRASCPDSPRIACSPAAAGGWSGRRRGRPNRGGRRTCSRRSRRAAATRGAAPRPIDGCTCA